MRNHLKSGKGSQILIFISELFVHEHHKYKWNNKSFFNSLFREWEKMRKTKDALYGMPPS